MRPALLLLLLAAAAAASASTHKPFVLFAAYPLVGHTTPLVHIAIELAKRGVAGRIVLANTAFPGSPQREIQQMFAAGGEAYGLGLEFVEVGFSPNMTAKTVSFGESFLKTTDVSARAIHLCDVVCV